MLKYGQEAPSIRIEIVREAFNEKLASSKLILSSANFFFFFL